MSSYALVENKVVTNIIEWEGQKVNPVTWPDGVKAIAYDPEKTIVESGYTYDSSSGSFTAPSQ